MKNKNFTAGFLLILLGILWLLSNLGILTFSVWEVASDLWPVVLIILGLNLIFKKNRYIVIIAWILFIIFAVFYGFYLENSTTYKLENPNIVLEKRSTLTNGDIKLELAAGDIELKSTKNELLNAYITDPRVYYETKINNSFKTAQIEFKNKKSKSTFRNKGYEYKFNLDEDLIWDINIKMGAMDGIFDLQNINFQNLDIDAGAGDIDILLGQKLKNSKVDIDIGAGDIDITIPKDLGVKIRFDGGVKHSNLRKLNWIHNDNYYISPNYDNVDKKINITVDIGAGNLNIRYE